MSQTFSDPNDLVLAEFLRHETWWGGLVSLFVLAVGDVMWYFWGLEFAGIVAALVCLFWIDHLFMDRRIHTGQFGLRWDDRARLKAFLNVHGKQVSDIQMG